MTDSSRRRFLQSVGGAAAGFVLGAGGIVAAERSELWRSRSMAQSSAASPRRKRPRPGDYLSYELDDGDILLEYGKYRFKTGSDSVSMKDGVVNFKVDIAEDPESGDTFDLTTTVDGVKYELSWELDDDFSLKVTSPKDEKADDEKKDGEEKEGDEKKEGKKKEDEETGKANSEAGSGEKQETETRKGDEDDKTQTTEADTKGEDGEKTTKKPKKGIDGDGDAKKKPKKDSDERKRLTDYDLVLFGDIGEFFIFDKSVFPKRFDDDSGDLEYENEFITIRARRDPARFEIGGDFDLTARRRRSGVISFDYFDGERRIESDRQAFRRFRYRGPEAVVEWDELRDDLEAYWTSRPSKGEKSGESSQNNKK